MAAKLYITTLFLIGLSTLSVWAQKGMYIAPLFSGIYNSNEKADVIILKGKKLKPYSLNLFHSISIKNSPDDVQFFEDAVLKDGENAADAQLIKKGDQIIAGYYQFLPLKSDKEQLNRFILFRKENDHTATLIYLEGKTELDQLIRIFINKKE